MLTSKGGNMKIIQNITFILATFALIGCSDECREYSDFTCKQIESATYNAYFYFPNAEKEYYLGVTDGLKQCGEMAHSYANSKELSGGSGWSYICCMKTESSECAEKHR